MYSEDQLLVDGINSMTIKKKSGVINTYVFDKNESYVPSTTAKKASHVWITTVSYYLLLK